MSLIIPRNPRPPAFPDVIVHSEMRFRNGHSAYSAAKGGDAESARRLVEDLISSAHLDRIAELIGGRSAILLPVIADETTGFNAIPDAMAQFVAAKLGLTAAAGNIVQANKVEHTKADGWHRLVTPAVFTGEVVNGAPYLLVDDHVGFGGTLANLRGFVENAGGVVTGMTTLTETRAARQIAIRPEVLNALRNKHGNRLEDFWRGEFGHGLDCLTNIEAGYLCRVESVAVIKNRMAQAAELARGRGLSPIGFVRGR